MRARGWGRVLFVSSESALQIPAEMIHYGMTKTAQIAVARGLAETLAGTGVTVNSLLPGTDALGRRLDLRRADGPRSRDRLRDDGTGVLHRGAAVVAAAAFRDGGRGGAMAVYLCGRLASATTGAAVRVDGGVVRAIV